MMLARIIFCSAVSLAILTVVLVALFSPLPHRKPSKHHTRPWLALSLYIQQPLLPTHHRHPVLQSDSGGAFIFHTTLTEGPENTSRVVGQAQGFIIPLKHFEHSAFNIIYLSFDTPEYSGSLSVQAKHLGHKDSEELAVVGGTGSFAFARGFAAFAETTRQSPGVDATYLIKLQLRFPNPGTRKGH